MSLDFSKTQWLSFWTTNKILFLILLLIFSALSSSSETALFSLNRFQLRRIKENYQSAYTRIRTLLSRPSRLLTLIILSNEVVNLSITNLITHSFQTAFLIPPVEDPGYKKIMTSIALFSLAFTVPLTLLLGEITPKVVATKINRAVAIINSKYLIFLYHALYPILFVVDGAISFALRKFKAEGKDHLSKTMSVLSEEDFVVLMEQGHTEGTVDPAERTLIKNVFEFDDSRTREIMTPISKTFSISASTKISDALPEILSQGQSKVPVYQKKSKNIVGIFYLKDLFPLKLKNKDLKAIRVEEIMDKPMFVPSSMRLSILFKRLKENKMHMAIVRDNDKVVGVVTMEVVLESIFGDIADLRGHQ